MLRSRVETFIIRGTLHETLTTIMLIKSFAAVAAASVLGAGSAFAGPYVNIETNAGYTGSDYNSATTDFHVGFEGDLGTAAGWYVQGGPALVNVDGEGTENEYSGKAGIDVDLSESLSAYGEVSFLTEEQEFDTEDLNVGVKAGVTYRF